MTIAQAPPRTFVNRLIDKGLEVEGLGRVRLNRYMCGNTTYGGNTNATVLRHAIEDLVKPPSEEYTLLHEVRQDRHGENYEDLWKGQGKIDHITTIMNIVWRIREKLKSYPQRGKGLAPWSEYFKESNPLQAMVNDKMFGLDCIGFVGRYLEWAHGIDHYHHWTPNQYIDIGHFRPIKGLKELKAGCVLAGGGHIAIVDQVRTVKGDRALINICQSYVTHLSKHNREHFQDYKGPYKNGPQLNVNVKIEQSGKDHFHVFHVSEGTPPANPGHVRIGKLADLVIPFDIPSGADERLRWVDFQPI